MEMQKEELVIAAWLLIIKYLHHFIYPLRRYFKFNIKYKTDKTGCMENILYLRVLI